MTRIYLLLVLGSGLVVAVGLGINSLAHVLWTGVVFGLLGLFIFGHSVGMTNRPHDTSRDIFSDNRVYHEVENARDQERKVAYCVWLFALPFFLVYGLMCIV